MTKNPPAPEVLALIPDGIENFVPRCVVCTAEVPKKRRSSRSKSTCSPPCHAVFTLYRKHLLISSKCIACYHPATPAERAEYREWRKARGNLRRKKGRPKVEKPILDPFADVPEPNSTTCLPNPLDIPSPIS